MFRRNLAVFSVAGVMVLALASAVVAAPAPAGKSASPGIRAVVTAHVVERATTDTVIDLGAEGDSIGDELAFGNDLYDASNTHKVGRDEGWCVRTNPGVAWECSWTNILPHGHTTVQGPFNDNYIDSNLSITGGTGLFKNARGQMLLHWRNTAGTEYDFEFLIHH